MFVIDNERELAKVTSIDAIIPIEGADNIELAQVGGWNVVVQKGLYYPGADVVYFEVDACLPIKHAAFEFLAERGTTTSDVVSQAGEILIPSVTAHRLRTIRLRGVYSQGLIVPLEKLRAEYDEWALDSEWCREHDVEDLTFATILGIGKYERDVAPDGRKAPHFDSQLPFPIQVVNKTDSERIQNLDKQLPTLSKYAYTVTEKVDGTSCTAFRSEDGALHVCSRNWELKFPGEGESNLYWDIARQYFGQYLEPGEVVQFEIAGPGIQGNRLDLEQVRPFVFEYRKGGDRFMWREWPSYLRVWSVPVVAELETLPPDVTAADLVERFDGLKSILNPYRLAEGVVFREHLGRDIPILGRPTFKVISNKYLTKEK